MSLFPEEPELGPVRVLLGLFLLGVALAAAALVPILIK